MQKFTNCVGRSNRQRNGVPARVVRRPNRPAGWRVNSNRRAYSPAGLVVGGPQRRRSADRRHAVPPRGWRPGCAGGQEGDQSAGYLRSVRSLGGWTARDGARRWEVVPRLSRRTRWAAQVHPNAFVEQLRSKNVSPWNWASKALDFESNLRVTEAREAVIKYSMCNLKFVSSSVTVLEAVILVKW